MANNQPPQSVNVIAQSKGIIFFSLDKYYRYTSFSPMHKAVMKQIWGADIAVGINMLDVLSEPDRTKAKQNFDKALHGETFVRIEEYGDTDLARSFWEDHYEPILDENDHVVGVAVLVIDVSNRREFSQVLKESHARLSLAVRAANIGIWEWNMATNQVVWSKEILDIFGLDESYTHLTLERYLSFVHPDDIDLVNQDISTAITNRSQYNTEHRIISPSKEIRWIFGTGQIIEEEDQPVKMIGTVTDITDRKILESTRLESASLLQAALESTADGLLVVSNEGKISAFNKRFLSMFGLIEQEIAGKSYEDLLKKVMAHIADALSFREKVNQNYTNPTNESLDIIRLTTGTILQRFSKPQVLDGKVVGRVWSFRDVTQQTEAQKSLQQSEELYRTITDNMIDMVSQVDREGKIMFASPSHFTVLGYKPEAMLNSSIFSQVHPDDLFFVNERFERVVKQKSSEKVEFRYKRANGSYAWLSVNSNPILGADGSIARVILSSRDISGRKKNEQALYHRDQMLSALAEATSQLAIEPNIWIGLQNALEILGKSTQVDRVYVFQNFSQPDGEYCSLKIEWNSGAAAPQIQNPSLQNFPYQAAPSLYDKLVENKSFKKHVREIEDPDFKIAMMEQDIKSVIILPIQVQNKLWGFIGVDECQQEREITQAEYSILKSFALTVGASLERKQIESENKDWQTRYELVTRASGQIVYDYFLPSGRIIWSDNLLKEIGYTKAEVDDVNKWSELIHPDDRAEAFALLDTAEKNLSEYNITYRFQTKSEGYQYMWDRGFFMANNQGKAYRMLGVMQNVNSQKLAETELKESEQRFRTLQEASFGGIALHKMGKIMDANKGLSDMTGYAMEELIGMNGLNLVADEFKSTVLNHIQSGHDQPYDIVGVRKDGTRYDIEVHGKNVPFKGETLRVTEFRDISERKEFEQKTLEQNKSLTIIADDLKKKNDQLEEFTQIVSHNLRSPVSNILSLLDFYDKATDDQEKAKLLSMLRESGSKILTNLHELNEVLKIKQAKDIERQHLSFSEVLQSVLQQLSARVAETKAKIKTEFAIEHIRYPNIYLESILMNLLSNALKYRHQDRTPEILVETFEQNGNLFLKITDNGLGLDLKRYGNHIFKLRKTFHVHPESRGIGLFMIKNQIEAMGGEIQIESEPNIGTSFIVLLTKPQAP